MDGTQPVLSRYCVAFVPWPGREHLVTVHVMIRFALDESTLHAVRLATSPLWEALASMALLARHSHAPHPYVGWTRTARERLPRDVREGTVDWLRTVNRPLPTLLTPVPSSAWPSLDEQLATLRATDLQGVLRELALSYPDGVPEPFHRFTTTAGLNTFADLIEAYWNACLTEVWDRLRPALDGEINRCGRVLATEGPGAMLLGLRGRMHWRPPLLSLPCHREMHRTLQRTRLTLVPTLFGRGMQFVADDGRGRLAVSYPAFAAETVNTLHPPAPEPLPDLSSGERLAILLGKSRATVILVLRQPTTTTAVARTVGLAASTVSEHLTALTAAGIVQRSRRGRRVTYGLAEGGRVLLDCMGIDPS